MLIFSVCSPILVPFRTAFKLYTMIDEILGYDPQTTTVEPPRCPASFKKLCKIVPVVSCGCDQCLERELFFDLVANRL